jgi:class 3 adenylate cyclase
VGVLLGRLCSFARVIAFDKQILVSNTVKDLVVGSGLRFDDRSEHDLKGVPGPSRLHAVIGDAER